MQRKGRKRTAVLAVAAVIAIGLTGLFYLGMSDKDGRIKVVLAMARAREAQNEIAAYYAERKTLPPDNRALRMPDKESKPYFTAFDQQANLSFAILVRDGTLTLTFASDQDSFSGKTLIFVPRISDKSVEWTCDTGTVDLRYRPPQCRGQ